VSVQPGALKIHGAEARARGKIVSCDMAGEKGEAEKNKKTSSAPKKGMIKKAVATGKSSAAGKKGLKIMNSNAAGLDLHKEEIWACAVAGEGFVTERFRTETAGLRKMAAWLRERGVTSAAMESTGVYWDAPMRILRESGIEAVLVNAKEIKSESGRTKTDKNDCQ
jgi:hypothetical protein